MKTIGQVLKLSCDWLQSKKSAFSRLEVEHLIASALHLNRLDLYMRFDQPLSDGELMLIRTRLTRLAKGEPLAYIEGTVSFYNLTLVVDKRVLIPRPETELLVDHVVKYLQTIPVEGKVLWDICTGSGCIGLAIKKAVDQLEVVLADISQDSLDVTKENAQLNGLEVTRVLGDLLAPFAGQKADFVVCNPPYISEAEFAQLDPHVRDFEPTLALKSGKTGFECYERLAHSLSEFLNSGARVWFEIGAGQAETVRTLFEKNHFHYLQTIRDLNDHERILEFAVK